MRSLLIIVLVGLLSMMAVIPSFADTGVGVSIPLTTTIVSGLEVLDVENGNVLPNGYVVPNLVLNRTSAVTYSLWVRNNSPTTDYIVTPIFSCNPVGYVICTSLLSKTVTKNTTVRFDFVMQGMIASSPTITLSFRKN